MPAASPASPPSLAEIAREWSRIGVTGFGGPPAHIALLRALCVQQRRWLSDSQFERAIAATNMLPGPASTQLAIYCAWRLRGGAGALLGGLCFIVPGLIAILALSVLFLAGSPPAWVRGAGLGAGAAVAAVAVRVGSEVALPIWRRAHGRALRARIAAYALAGGLAAAAAGPWLVLVLLACGALELAWSGTLRRPRTPLLQWTPWPALGAAAATGGVGALVWTAFKVGALAFGGGFVIVPLMEADAVGHHHWMTHSQFLNAVALGQVTPGPVVQTVAAVGYAEGGLAAGLLAALIAFSPSFCFILIGARRFERLLADERVRAFLAGAAPAAAGAIVGAAIPLTRAIAEDWQYALLGAAAVALIALRRSVVLTLLAAGAIGALVAALGAPLPH
jgi:chromate transporter